MSMNAIREAFEPRRLVTSLTGGLIGAILIVVFNLSLAVLIFSGDLTEFAANGIGLILFGAFAICLVSALTSSFTGTLAGPQDSPAAILALVAVALIQSMPATASPQEKYITVVTTIILTSLVTGIFFLILGYFKLGSLVRFVPFPVVGGFLAGTGWLLLIGSLGVMTASSLSLSTLGTLLSPGLLASWLPGTLFGVLLLLVMRRTTKFWVLPALLVAAVAAFYIILAVMHIGVADAGARGWLLGPFPQGRLWQPPSPAALGQVDWTLILGQLDKIGTIVLVSVVSLLLNASGIELATREDIDLNRELRSAGMANIAAGLGGGSVGYPMLSGSVLVHKMGSRGRLAGLVAAAACGTVLFFGAPVLSYFPKPLLGGLLMYLGLSFLAEWVYDAWFRLPRVDYFLVLAILVIVGTLGFLQGVAAGIAIAVVLFVVNYSRINVVKHALSGVNYRSRVDRPGSHRQVLREKGGEIAILQLQSYIFFGTAQRLLEEIRLRMEDPAQPDLRFILLDFQRVVGLDSSAVSSFVRMEQLAELRKITLVLTDLNKEMQGQLKVGGLFEGANEFLRLFPALDYGLEWCENQILVHENLFKTQIQDSLQSQLRRVFPESVDVSRLMGYLEKQRVEQGFYLMHRGDPPDSMYFIESGQATAQLEQPDGDVIRLRTMRSGTVVGEAGLYLGNVRTASVVTATATILYRLSIESLREMERKDPEVALALHQFLARLLAERLAENNEFIEAVLE